MSQSIRAIVVMLFCIVVLSGCAGVPWKTKVTQTYDPNGNVTAVEVNQFTGILRGVLFGGPEVITAADERRKDGYTDILHAQARQMEARAGATDARSAMYALRVPIVRDGLVMIDSAGDVKYEVVRNATLTPEMVRALAVADAADTSDDHSVSAYSNEGGGRATADVRLRDNRQRTQSVCSAYGWTHC